jgi:heptosyltransferase-3
MCPRERRLTDRIIIYRLGSLGDTVAALPCFHLIEQSYPDSERIVLTNVPESTKAAPLDTILKPGGFIHASIPYPLGLRRPGQLAALAKALQDQRAHTLIYLAASRGLAAAWRDVAFFRLCGFANIIGAPLTADLQRHRADETGCIERESHRLVRTLQKLGSIDLEDRSWWDLRLTKEEESTAEEALSSIKARPFVALNTGGKTSQKDWGIDRWKTLLIALSEELGGWGLAFVGSREDQHRAAELGALWPGVVLDLCGHLSPRASAAALSHASLFIGHDSGALHLADAVGVPAIGIFGSYNRPKIWHPCGATTRIIHRMSGLNNITPDEVISEASSLVTLVDQQLVDHG